MKNILKKTYKKFENNFRKLSEAFINSYIGAVKNFLTGTFFVALNYIIHIIYNILLNLYIIPGTILIVNMTTLISSILIVLIFVSIMDILYDSKKDMYLNMIPGFILLLIGFIY